MDLDPKTVLQTVSSLATGTPPPGSDRTIDECVKARFEAIIPTIKEKDGDYCYDGPRCKPENLGWRVAQNFRIKKGALTTESLDAPLPPQERILAGEFDDLLIFTYHDAASAEYYYRYEKDWGFGYGKGA